MPLIDVSPWLVAVTFCFDALKRATGSISGSPGAVTSTGAVFPLTLDGLGGMARLGARTRAISESSASPRVVSPSDISLFTSSFGQDRRDGTWARDAREFGTVRPEARDVPPSHQVLQSPVGSILS